MSEKILSSPNDNCKDFFQFASPALQLSRSIAAQLSEPVPPLRRHRSHWPITYESAIALKLAARQQRSPAAVAAEIAACTIEGWQIQASRSGIVRLQCSEPKIAAHLQHWLAVPQGCTSSELHLRSLPPNLLFHVQYVHARCWMLLRSAVREGWFNRSNPPPELPWLTCTDRLRLQQSIERQTIGLLFDTVDVLATGQSSNRLWKQAIALSRQLEACQAACRIWGEVKARDLPLAQARLGLTWVGQQLLQVLLSSIDLDAPTLL